MTIDSRLCMRLERNGNGKSRNIDTANGALTLSTTPSQALEVFAAKVREQCVERLNIHHFVTGAAYHSTVSAIKGIKELP